MNAKSNIIFLHILTTSNGVDRGDGNLPSHFFPGAGAGHGLFQIEGEGQGYPSHRVLSHALAKWQQDSMLMEYDEQTGTGRFVIVDGDAPEPGSIVELRDTITPCDGAALTLTLGAEGIAALESYRAARSRLRNTSISNMKEWSLRNEDCYREGAQLAAWVFEVAEAQEKIYMQEANRDVASERAIKAFSFRGVIERLLEIIMCILGVVLLVEGFMSAGRDDLGAVLLAISGGMLIVTSAVVVTSKWGSGSENKETNCIDRGDARLRLIESMKNYLVVIDLAKSWDVVASFEQGAGAYLDVYVSQGGDSDLAAGYRVKLSEAVSLAKTRLG